MNIHCKHTSDLHHSPLLLKIPPFPNTEIRFDTAARWSTMCIRSLRQYFFLEFPYDCSLRDIKASCSRHKLRVTAAFLVMIFPILQVTRHIIADYSRAFLGMRCREISERVNVRTLLRLVVHLYGILTGAEHIFILYYRFAL